MQHIAFTTADIIYRPADGGQGNRFKQFSQELRLAGATDRVNWLVGAFYAKEDLTSKATLRYGTNFESYLSGLLGGLPLSAVTGRAAGTVYAAGAGNLDVYKQEGTTWALFSNNSIQVTDKLELTVGLRYTKDEKTLDAVYSNIDGAVGCAGIATWANAAVTTPAASRAAIVAAIGVGGRHGARAQLLGDARGHRARRDTTRLGMANQAVAATTGRQADFRQLRGLAGAGLTGHDDNLMLRNGGNQLVAYHQHRQVGRPVNFGRNMPGALVRFDHEPQAPRSSRRRILPTLVFGKSARKTIVRGTL